MAAKRLAALWQQNRQLFCESKETDKEGGSGGGRYKEEREGRAGVAGKWTCGCRPSSTRCTSWYACCWTQGLEAKYAVAQANKMAEVSWPAIRNVMSSSRNAWSVILPPSTSSAEKGRAFAGKGPISSKTHGPL